MLRVFLYLQISFVTHGQIQLAVRFYIAYFCLDDLSDAEGGVIFAAWDQSGISVVYSYKSAEIFTEFINPSFYSISCLIGRIGFQQR